MYSIQICFLVLIIKFTNANNNGSFPDYFQFGVATAAYQIEGAWNEDRKGESMWDRFVHQNSSKVKNNDTGDIACDSYHKYKEDVRLAAGLGVQFYRFSISWSRILPTGYTDQINTNGLEYYKNVTNEIIKHNMTPVATLYHWDLPQPLVSIGWDNPKITDIFVNYSRIVIQNLPNVGIWLTINEPKQICRYGYGTGLFPPEKMSSGLAEYQCGYNILMAHAKTYHMYKEEFSHYKAKMTITIDCQWYEPLTNSISDKEAAQRVINFECGIYIHPLYIGNWPENVRTRINERSMMENYITSRLPILSLEEIDYIKGTSDFLSLNFYYTNIVENALEGNTNITSWENDVRVNRFLVPGAKLGCNNNGIVPWGLNNLLKFIKDEYKDPEILITELGVCDDGTTLDDDIRIEYYAGHFNSVLDAMYEYNVKLKGIAAWSLLDNFEWIQGYSQHFGLYHVDFNDPNRTRTPKKSAEFFKNVVQTRRLPTSSDNINNEDVGSVGTVIYNLNILMSTVFLFLLVSVVHY